MAPKDIKSPLEIFLSYRAAAKSKEAARNSQKAVDIAKETEKKARETEEKINEMSRRERERESREKYTREVNNYIYTQYQDFKNILKNIPIERIKKLEYLVSEISKVRISDVTDINYKDRYYEIIRNSETELEEARKQLLEECELNFTNIDTKLTPSNRNKIFLEILNILSNKAKCQNINDSIYKKKYSVLLKQLNEASKKAQTEIEEDNVVSAEQLISEILTSSDPAKRLQELEIFFAEIFYSIKADLLNTPKIKELYNNIKNQESPEKAKAQSEIEDNKITCAEKTFAELLSNSDLITRFQSLKLFIKKELNYIQVDFLIDQEHKNHYDQLLKQIALANSKIRTNLGEENWKYLTQLEADLPRLAPLVTSINSLYGDIEESNDSRLKYGTLVSELDNIYEPILKALRTFPTYGTTSDVQSTLTEAKEFIAEYNDRVLMLECMILLANIDGAINEKEKKDIFKFCTKIFLPDHDVEDIISKINTPKPVNSDLKANLTIKIYCPKCNQEYEITEKYIGKKAECEKCDFTFIVESVEQQNTKDECKGNISNLTKTDINKDFVFPKYLSNDNKIFFLYYLRELACAENDKSKQFEKDVLIEACRSQGIFDKDIPKGFWRKLWPLKYERKPILETQTSPYKKNSFEANNTYKEETANKYELLEARKTQTQWYDKTWIVVILFFIFWPVGLYALWKNNKISKNTKIVVSAIFALCVFLTMIHHY